MPFFEIKKKVEIHYYISVYLQAKNKTKNKMEF